MIKDIVFDGTVISYTYEVKTDKDLGEYVSFHPETKNIFTMINGKYSGSCYSKCKKVSDNNYLGRAQITIERVENLEKVDLELMFNSVTGYDENHKKVDDIKGEWNFNIKDIPSLKNEVINVDKSTKKDDISINIKSITKSPISLKINYSQEISDDLYDKMYGYEKEDISPEDMKDKMNKSAQMEFDKLVKLEVKDNLGNEYVSSGNFNGDGDGKKTELIDVFKDIDEKATQLIITPKNSESVFDEIIVDLDKSSSNDD